jgi:hypothetical protein
MPLLGMDGQYNNVGDKIGSSYTPSEIKKKNPQGDIIYILNSYVCVFKCKIFID